MAMRMMGNPMLNLALRAFQVIFAIIVMGTDGYAINVYRGYTSIIETPEGRFEGYFGVTNAWGFLIFCAGWTVLVVVFQLIADRGLLDRAYIGYIRVAVEMVALLSWFAGWIAVAVDIGTGACAKGYVSCGALKAATVFGAMDWLLFVFTAFFAVLAFIDGRKQVEVPKP